MASDDAQTNGCPKAQDSDADGIVDDEDESDSNAANSTDLVAKFLEEFMCQGLSPAVCYDNSRKTPEWLDCNIDIRATIC